MHKKHLDMETPAETAAADTDRSDTRLPQEVAATPEKHEFSHTRRISVWFCVWAETGDRKHQLWRRGGCSSRWRRRLNAISPLVAPAGGWGWGWGWVLLPPESERAGRSWSICEGRYVTHRFLPAAHLLQRFLWCWQFAPIWTTDSVWKVRCSYVKIASVYSLKT